MTTGRALKTHRLPTAAKSIEVRACFENYKSHVFVRIIETTFFISDGNSIHRRNERIQAYVDFTEFYENFERAKLSNSLPPSLRPKD